MQNYSLNISLFTCQQVTKGRLGRTVFDNILGNNSTSKIRWTLESLSYPPPRTIVFEY